jgi:hypothetical protein
MRSQILVPLITLAVAAQVCCCCSILGGPEPPYVIAPSEEAARRVAEGIHSSEPGADGTFTISISEEEMTSLIVQRLAAQEQAASLATPQIHFRNNRAEFYATVRFSQWLALPGLVAFSLGVTNGDPEVTVEEIALGPLPVPESILQSLADVLNETLASIQVAGGSIEFTDIQIGEGQMTISGRPSLAP